MNNINLQLYSFGWDSGMTCAEKIACAGKMGYAGVEFAREYANPDGSLMPVEEVKAALDAAGVKAVSAHIGFEHMEEHIPYLAKLGVKYAACPMTDFATKEEAREVAEELNKWGKFAKEYGVTLGYHNHTQEFKVDQGKYLYDWLIEFSDPEVTAFEVDCGWCSASGASPVDFINSHAGRIKAIHIKENGAVCGVDEPRSRHAEKQDFHFELDEDGKPIFPPEFLERMKERDKLNVPTGSGIVDWKAVKAAADAQCDDVIYVVEREASYGGKSRVECLQEDINWLKANI